LFPSLISLGQQEIGQLGLARQLSEMLDIIGLHHTQPEPRVFLGQRGSRLNLKLNLEGLVLPKDMC